LTESCYRVVSQSILSIILQKDISVRTGGYICQWVSVRFARKDRIVLSSVGCHFAGQLHLFKTENISKMNNQDQELTLTYNDEQKCLYCNMPIADQEHGLRLYCPDLEFTDGSRESCKDRHNTKLKKLRYAAVLEVYNYYKKMLESIEALIATHGHQVSLDNVNHAGINLKMALVIDQDSSGLYSFSFPGYKIQCFLITNLKYLHMSSYIDNGSYLKNLLEDNGVVDNSRQASSSTLTYIFIGVVIICASVIAWQAVMLESQNRQLSELKSKLPEQKDVEGDLTDIQSEST